MKRREGGQRIDFICGGKVGSVVCGFVLILQKVSWGEPLYMIQLWKWAKNDSLWVAEGKERNLAGGGGSCMKRLVESHKGTIFWKTCTEDISVCWKSYKKKFQDLLMVWDIFLSALVLVFGHIDDPET